MWVMMRAGDIGLVSTVLQFVGGGLQSAGGSREGAGNAAAATFAAAGGGLLGLSAKLFANLGNLPKEWRSRRDQLQAIANRDARAIATGAGTFHNVASAIEPMNHALGPRKGTCDE